MSRNSVTVLGLGAMGTALAKTLARGGVKVTGWNRTPRDVAVFADAGVKIVSSLVEAVAASPIILLVTADFSANRSVLQDEEAQRVLALFPL